ncbi:hypothetical protein [Kitasatospora purpeofusca]|uniref:hypothetical protein n=1 Tax=Kitasatospora purpeofusca TaxID=67352 RepID=UPI0035D926E5
MVETHSAAYRQWTATSGGIRSVGSLSAFDLFDFVVTATSVNGLPRSLAQASRRPASHTYPPTGGERHSGRDISSAEACGGMRVTRLRLEPFEPGGHDQGMLQSRSEEVGVGISQDSADGDGFQAGGQALGPSTRLTEVDGEVVEGHGEVGQMGIGVGLGQRAVVTGRLLRDGQALGAPARLGQPDREVVEGCGEVGQVGVGSASARVR